jgi:hypothetical protein
MNKEGIQKRVAVDTGNNMEQSAMTKPQSHLDFNFSLGDLGRII